MVRFKLISNEYIGRTLDKSADLIESCDWARGFFAKTSGGDNISTRDPGARQFSLAGAVVKVCQDEFNSNRVTTDQSLALVIECVCILKAAIGGDRNLSISDWNDDPKRTKMEVMAVLRSCAASLS